MSTQWPHRRLDTRDAAVSGVTPAAFGHTAWRYAVIDSTNLEALRLARAAAGGEGDPSELHGTVLWADEQTGGIGRLGRQWASARGGLWFSLLLTGLDEPSLPRVSWLNLASSLAVAEAVDAALHGVAEATADTARRPVAGGIGDDPAVAVSRRVEACATPRAAIKWPNDVYIADADLPAPLRAAASNARDTSTASFSGGDLGPRLPGRKLCGVLTQIESVGGLASPADASPTDPGGTTQRLASASTDARTGRGPLAAVVGVGLNVNQRDFPAAIAERAVSLAQLTGTEHDLAALLRAVLGRLDYWWPRIGADSGSAELRSAIEQRSLLRDSDVDVRLPDSVVVSGRYAGLSEHGHLRLDVAGRVEGVRSGVDATAMREIAAGEVIAVRLRSGTAIPGCPHDTDRQE